MGAIPGAREDQPIMTNHGKIVNNQPIWTAREKKADRRFLHGRLPSSLTGPVHPEQQARLPKLLPPRSRKDQLEIPAKTKIAFALKQAAKLGCRPHLFTFHHR
jgi:hypothetical protein